MKKIYKYLIIIVLLIILCNNTFSQTNGDYRSKATGNWDNTASWQKFISGSWQNATDYPAQNSASGLVTIQSGHNITLTVSPINNLGSLTIDGSLLFSSISQQTLKVAGNVSNAGTINMSGGYHQLKIGGDFSNQGVFTAGVATVEFNGTTGNQQVGSATFYSLSLTSAGNKTLQGEVVVNGTFTTSVTTTVVCGNHNLTLNGIVTNNGALSVDNNTVTFGGATAQNVIRGSYYNLSIAGSGVKTLQGAVTVNNTYSSATGTTLACTNNNLTFNGNFTNNGSLTVTTNTITYSGDNEQNIIPTTYSSLVLSGLGAKNLIVGTGVSGTFYLNTNLNCGNYNLTLNGNAINSNGILSCGSNTVTYGGTLAQNIIPANYNNLTINGAGIKYLTGNTIVNNSFTMNTHLNCGNNNITFAGVINYTAGTLTVGSNTVTYSASVTQNIFPINYFNLIINGSGDKNLVYNIVVNSLFSMSSNLLCGANNIILNGNIEYISGNLLVGSNTITYGGSSAQNIISTNYSGLTISGSGTKNLLAETHVNGTLTMSSNLNCGNNNLILNNTVTYYTGNLIAENNSISYLGDVSQNIIPTNYNNLTIGGLGAKTFLGNTIINTFIVNSDLICNSFNLTLNGNITYNSGLLSVTNNTINYNSNSDQIIIPANYHNISTSGGTKNLIANITVNNNFSINSGTVNLGEFTANNINWGLFTINNGSLLKIGGTNSFPTNYSYDIGNSTIIYNGYNQIISGPIFYYNLQVINNEKTLAENITIAGELMIDNCNFNLNDKTLTLSGTLNYINNGKFVTNNLSGICAHTPISLHGVGELSSLTVNCQNQNDAITLNENITINNELKLHNGIINNNSLANITLNQGVTLTRNPNGKLLNIPNYSSTGDYQIQKIIYLDGNSYLVTDNELLTPDFTVDTLIISTNVILNHDIAVNSFLEIYEDKTLTDNENAPKNVLLYGSVLNQGFFTGNGMFSLCGSGFQSVYGGGVCSNMTLNSQSSSEHLVHFVNNQTITGNLSISANNKLQVENNQTVFIKGNINNFGNISGKLALNGTNNQQINGNFDFLIIDNAANINLTGNCTINNNLQINSGNIFLNNYDLILDTSASVTNVNPCMTVINGTGLLIKKFNTLNNSTPFVFPIGNCNNGFEYSPVTINSISGTYNGIFTVKASVSNQKHSNIIVANYLKRYWTVTTGLQNPTLSFTANYNETDVVGNEELLHGAQRFNNSWKILPLINLFDHTIQTGELTSSNGFIFTAIECTYPSPSGNISGLQNVCAGSSNVSYSVSSISNATSYLWSYTGVGAAFNETTNPLIVNFSNTATSGNLTVRGLNVCGEGQVSGEYPIFVNPLPSSAGAISGLSTVCQGTSNVPYSILAIENATNYIWNYTGTGATIIGTSNSIVINFSNTATSGVLTIVGNNSCGNGQVSEYYAITVNPLPLAASTINGSGVVCQSAINVLYSVASIPNASNYIWSYTGTGVTIIGNTNSVTISFSNTATSGILTVKGNNSCGDGTISNNFTITVNPLPAAAGIISGNSTVCQSETNVTYSIPIISNASNYLWNYSGSGVTINGNSNSVEVTYSTSATSGILTVSGNNACGNGAVSADFSITVNPLPSSAGSISGYNSVCQGHSNITYTVPEIENAISYLWNFTGNGAIMTENGNSISVIFSNTATSGSLTVKGSNACGYGLVSQNFSITVNPLPSVAGIISGDNSACQAESNVTYTIPTISNTDNYIWNFSGTGANFSGNGNNININFSQSATSGYLNVKGQNSCGNGVSSNLAIIVNPLPSQPTMPSGATFVCQNSADEIYTSTGASNSSTYNWTLQPPESGVVTGNGTTTSVNWNNDFFGNVLISLQGVNACGLGKKSDDLVVIVNPLPLMPIVTQTDNVLTSSAIGGNQWFNESGAIPNATNKTFTISISGIYWVAVTENTCTSVSLQKYYQYVGINNALLNNAIQIIPNPNKGDFNIHISNNLTGKAKISIINSLGITIKSIEINDIQNNSIIPMHNYGINKGIYFIEIIVDNERVVKKIVVN